jgi:hypothetical protein
MEPTREELAIFSREVIRFGDLCKDPIWHNLGRYFDKYVSQNYAFHSGMSLCTNLSALLVLKLYMGYSDMQVNERSHAPGSFKRAYRNNCQTVD